MDITVDASQLMRFERRLARYPTAVTKRISEMGPKYQERLRQEAVRNASGRPGPQIVTGAYISHFITEVRHGFGSFEISLGNSSPQAARLELGFIGTDSLGRNYNQPPFPHMIPALHTVGDEMKKEIRMIPITVWRRGA